MKSILRRASLVFLALIASGAVRAHAFSLLGPYTDWMVVSNDYRRAYDIGGPMDINEEYRWNVPVLTYGFDKSFVAYFGSNGVAAVERAIQILNDLPPAANIVLTNYPLETRQKNFIAEAQGLLDLKSVALSLLVEQMGLAEPTRNIFSFRNSYEGFPSNQSEWESWAIPDFIIERNFDPETLLPDRRVNGTLYFGHAGWSGSVASVSELPVDPLAPAYNAVADRNPGSGDYFTGLTRDDVGGLRYLLSADNVNFEEPLRTVWHWGNRFPARVNGAWRPGVEKVSFVPHAIRDDGRFQPMMLSFTDRYVARGAIVKRPARRILLRPDILFTAADTGRDNSFSPIVRRTGTDRWKNYAHANSSATSAGPGVIQPGIEIAFHKLSTVVFSSDVSPDVQIQDQGWGSFDHSPIYPVAYPAPEGRRDSLTMHLRSRSAAGSTDRTVVLPIAFGGNVALQISANGTDWTTIAVLINFGGVIDWYHYSSGEQQFLRAIAP